MAPYIKDGGIPNQGDLNFGNEGDVLHSDKPTVTPPPVEPGIDKDVEGEDHLDLTNRDDEFNWHVKATFGNTTSNWEQASIVDDVNKLLEIKNVVVKDENGTDVTKNGELTIKDNKIVFNINKQDDSYGYLSGHEYTMTITTVIGADVTDEELAPYIKDGGIPNQGDLNFGNEGDVLHSGKPVVTPPTPDEPENPDKPNTPGKPNKPSTPDKPNGKVFPKTNELISMKFVWVGIIFVLISFVLLLFKSSSNLKK